MLMWTTSYAAESCDSSNTTLNMVVDADAAHIQHRSPPRGNNHVTFSPLHSKGVKLDCKNCKDSDSTEPSLKTEVSEKYRCRSETNEEPILFMNRLIYSAVFRQGETAAEKEP
ncbi:hypothetical protein EVAR_59950_1 [Eumeta japonica]|uniref:Uncharacterized protein n=1 Tax=Eumeta variegata TaxID=151549 RepID=A0A4C1YSM1_EUMVA|nr:hypothetical protein EVAR_59950_1 [Eumeta japonica]